MEQQTDSSNYNYKHQEKQETPLEEKGVECQPKIVASGGEHEHFWVEDWKPEDDEYGRQHVICTKPNCWHGAYYQPETETLIDGKISRKG